VKQHGLIEIHTVILISINNNGNETDRTDCHCTSQQKTYLHTKF